MFLHRKFGLRIVAWVSDEWEVKIRWQFLNVVREWGQVAEEYFRREYVRWADDDFPIFNGSGYFIRTSHLGVAQATHDEYNQTWNVLYCRLRFVFVPLAVTGSVQRIRSVRG